eukprot:5827779-Pyramimonas_sp.AAC.2
MVVYGSGVALGMCPRKPSGAAQGGAQGVHRVCAGGVRGCAGGEPDSFCGHGLFSIPFLTERVKDNVM